MGIQDRTENGEEKWYCELNDTYLLKYFIQLILISSSQQPLGP